MMALPGEEERRMRRPSVQGYLSQNWPVETAVEKAKCADAVRSIWCGLGRLGLAGIGVDPEEGGLREISVVVEQLGRSACPAPMIGAAMLNLLARIQPTFRSTFDDLLADLAVGSVSVAFSFGAYDSDANAGSTVLRDGRLTGIVRFVEDIQYCTHVALVARADSLYRSKK